MSLSFDIYFSFIGLIAIGVLLWGTYKGYKNGPIISALTLFALSAGFMASAFISYKIYGILYDESSVPHVFGALSLLVFFAGAVIFSNYVFKLSKDKIQTGEMKNKERMLGAFFSMIKYFIIIGVFSVVLITLNKSGNFLPRREREKNIITTTAFLMKRVVRYTRLEDPNDTIADYTKSYKKNYGNGHREPVIKIVDE